MQVTSAEPASCSLTVFPNDTFISLRGRNFSQSGENWNPKRVTDRRSTAPGLRSSVRGGNGKVVVKRLVVGVCLMALAIPLLTVHAMTPTVQASPLMAFRAEQSETDVLGVGQTMGTPKNSNAKPAAGSPSFDPASGCALSVCPISACLSSVCIGSGCASVCIVSYQCPSSVCIGSCLSSNVAGSGCPSYCDPTTTCTDNSACMGSNCASSGCLNSSYCSSSSCVDPYVCSVGPIEVLR